VSEVPAALLPIPSSGPQATHLDSEAPLDLLILSKDRACQLDGLLRSVRAFLTVPHRIHVLYTSSNIAYERGYDLVRRWNPDVQWSEDGGTFRESYLEQYTRIAQGPGRYLMPVMDDMIFTRPFTAQPLLELLDDDEDVLAISLRLGENVTYCYVRNAPTTPPDFSKGYRWEWKTASPGYWNYPMSVDANIFRTAEMAEYVPRLAFGKAEVVEAKMAQQPLNRPHMVCEKTPSVLNLAINRVQDTFKNRHGGIAPGALNGAFLSGFAMDVRPFLGVTYDSCHVDVELSMVPDRRREHVVAAPRSSLGWRPARGRGVTEESDGESIKISPGDNAGKVSLNSSAEMIWQLCDGTRTVEQIQEEIATRFQGQQGRIRRDVRVTLDSFRQQGLLGYDHPIGKSRRIDLREIPCFVLNCKDDVAKRQFMERQLADLEIPFEIVRGIKADPGWVGVALSHLKILRLTRVDVPFLVLEDDCLFNDLFEPVWEVPVEAEALYLGVSEFGLQTPGEFSWGKHRNVRWEPYDDTYLRIYNMLARHAVVYLSADYCEEVIQSQIAALTNHTLPYPGDIGCTMLQASHIVLTPNDPICRQTDRDSTARPLREH